MKTVHKGTAFCFLKSSGEVTSAFFFFLEKKAKDLFIINVSSSCSLKFSDHLIVSKRNNKIKMSIFICGFEKEEEMKD